MTAKQKSPITMEQAQTLARETLSPHRFFHTQCVVKAARQLAAQYGANRQKAELAAWLHDILKERSDADLLHWLKGSDIIDESQIRRMRPLWHAYAAERYVRAELGLGDDVAYAIAFHTAGRPGMTLLEKVVFIADYISEDREFRGADEVREIVKTSLDRACLVALRNGLIHLCKLEKTIDVRSVLAFNDFVNIGSEL
jgi:predicted HD superfamily hydrolase involved in NAD metabolism